MPPVMPSASPARPRPIYFPTASYTIPEISMVGRNEDELTRDGVPYEIGVARYREIARGQIIGDTVGMLKLLFHSENRELLGRSRDRRRCDGIDPHRPSGDRPSAASWIISSTRFLIIRRWRNVTKSRPWPRSTNLPATTAHLAASRRRRCSATQPHSGNFVRANFVNHSYLSRRAIRIAVFVQVFFRQRIDMRVGAAPR